MDDCEETAVKGVVRRRTLQVACELLGRGVQRVVYILETKCEGGVYITVPPVPVMIVRVIREASIATNCSLALFLL
jgi:hypothetical protein